MKISKAVKEYISAEVTVQSAQIEEDLKIERAHKADFMETTKTDINAKFRELIAPKIKEIAAELEKLVPEGLSAKASTYRMSKDSDTLESTLLERISDHCDIYVEDPTYEDVNDAVRNFARKREKVIQRIIAMLELGKITSDQLDETIAEEVKGLAA